MRGQGVASQTHRGTRSLRWTPILDTTDDVTATTVQFTRPLCAHPKIARYAAGDPGSAASFVCVGPADDGGDDDGGDDDD